jgi:TolA-binding protein
MKVSLRTIGFGSLLGLLVFPACQTKSDLRRQQEVEKIKQELTQVRGDKADIETTNEELKVEISRLSNVIEQRALQQLRDNDEFHKDIAALGTRIQAIEQRMANEDNASKNQPPPERVKPTYDLGKRLFDEGKFNEASDVLKAVTRGKPHSDDARKAQFLLGESLFSAKDYASAVLEYSEFKKSYPKDALIPNAIYRQANSFRSMGRSKEARLFYQELIEKFPKNSFSTKAKQEMKKLK